MNRIAYAPLVAAASLLAAVAGLAQEPDPHLRQSVSSGWSYNDNRDGVATNRQGVSEFSLGYRVDRWWRDGDRTEFDLLFAPVAAWRTPAGEGGDGSPVSLLGSLGFDLRHAATPRTELTASDTLRSSDVLSGGSAADSSRTTGSSQRDSSRSLVNDARLGASLDLDPQEALLLSLGQTLVRYPGAAQGSDNVPSDTWRTSATLAETLDVRRRMLFTTGAQRTRQETANAKNTAGSTLYSATVGWEETFDPDLIGLVQAGGQNVQQDGPGQSSWGWTADANLTAGATTPTRGRLAAHYGIEPSGVSGYAVSRTFSGTAGVDHDLIPQRLTVGLQGSLVLSRYDVGAQGGSDRTINVDVTGSYRLTPHWTVQGRVGREEWQSDLRSSFRRHRVSLSVSTMF